MGTRDPGTRGAQPGPLQPRRGRSEPRAQTDGPVRAGVVASSPARVSPGLCAAGALASRSSEGTEQVNRPGAARGGAREGLAAEAGWEQDPQGCAAGFAGKRSTVCGALGGSAFPGRGPALADRVSAVCRRPESCPPKSLPHLPSALYSPLPGWLAPSHSSFSAFVLFVYLLVCVLVGGTQARQGLGEGLPR